MKNIYVLILSIFISSCSNEGRYHLKDSGVDKTYLSDTIKVLSKRGTISEEPLIMIDGYPFSYERLEIEKLPIYKKDIIKFDVLDKKTGMNLYKKLGPNGVILISTKPNP